jgi:hypothetical protein
MLLTLVVENKYKVEFWTKQIFTEKVGEEMWTFFPPES